LTSEPLPNLEEALPGDVVGINRYGVAGCSDCASLRPDPIEATGG